MSKVAEYLAKSAQFLAEAAEAADPKRRADLEWLANSYRLLAEHAGEEDSNVVHLRPQPHTRQQPQPQQQQQSKLETDDKPTPEAE
jgi:hypothetical protein